MADGKEIGDILEGHRTIAPDRSHTGTHFEYFAADIDLAQLALGIRLVLA